jgi:hypothetical protein
MADITIRNPIKAKYESVAVSSTSIGLTPGNYSYESATTLSKTNAERAMITVETDQIRWTCDGTTPTATVGHRCNVDDVINLEGSDAIRLFRCIRITGDCAIKVSYFGG